VGAFVARRVGQAAVTLFGLTLLTFVLLHLLPGGPAAALLGSHSSPQAVAALNRSFGLNRPIPAQYLTWLLNLAHLRLGQSYQLAEPVSTVLANHIPPTLLMAGTATLLSLLFAVPIGTLQALRRNDAVDHTITVSVLFAYSTPIFWFGLIFISIFSLKLNWLPSGGIVGIGQDPSDLAAELQHLILPVATLSLAFIATWSRYVRSSVIDALSQDFVRTARAKGMPTTRMLFRHALPNGLISTITLIGTSLPFIIAGSVVAEVVFNYQGMGYLFWQSAQARDFPVLMGIVTLLGVLTVTGSLAADVATALLDPRIRKATAI
jgi:peptide/nickel transport system permease protein